MSEVSQRVMKALVAINSGSSSCKFSAYQLENNALEQLFNVQTDHSRHTLRYRDPAGNCQTVNTSETFSSLQQALFGLQYSLDQLRQRQADICAIGHRFAHSGPQLLCPTVVNTQVLEQLQEAVSFAPLHMPNMVSLLEQTIKIAADVPQVACFDTSFHQTRPAVEKYYAIPQHFSRQGIYSYGFHGLSYQSIVSQLQQQQALAERLVVLHLGNGASICAIHNGRSIYTSMGFSPLDGLAMGSRCGHIDPGALIHMLRDPGLDNEKLETILYKESGLLALSGESPDMRDLLDSNSERAAFAIDYFCHKINLHVGQACASLGGIDQLVFTGGIGENAARIRDDVCQRLHWLGVSIDHEKNLDRSKAIISREDSRVSVWTLACDENRTIAEQSLACINAGSQEDTR